MAKDRTLKAALDRYKGVDYKLEKQKKLQKQAEKRKRTKDPVQIPSETTAENDVDVKESKRRSQKHEKLARESRAADKAEAVEAVNGEAGGWETDESEAAEEGELDGVEIGALEDESDSDDESIIDGDEDGPTAQNGDASEDEVAEDDIPLSDIESLASEERGDVIPHQRLTINNVSALQRSLKSFALPTTLPFSANQTVISTEPLQIKDVEDDLNRELAFYKQSLDAVKEARTRLKKEGAPFSRPADYFAEMVKSEEQMGKVRQKMLDEAGRKKASADARRQRDLKKFGKAVQVAKLQERDKAKRQTMDKIGALKRKRQGADLNANEDDMFDVALEDAATTEKADRAARRTSGAGPNHKRVKKDEKFGFGGKKRFAKSNDAKSSGDVSKYSVGRMKGKAAKQRPGKSRRAKAH